MRVILSFLLFTLFLGVYQIKGQNIRLYASPRGNADVLDANNDTLLNPWCGGWLNPEFSNIDLNGDGLLDLFVFLPGIGTNLGNENRVLTFINTGDGQYQYAPDYESYFPDMQYWTLLVDYNKDGKPDIFTYAAAGSGMDVYKNISDSNGLKFIKVTPENGRLDYTDNNHQKSNIFSSPYTIPAITDVDGDGDIDIVSFDVLFSTAWYFKNNAVEKGESLDSLDFTESSCHWGHFITTGSLYPSVDSTLTIHAKLDPCFGTSMSQNKHGASTMLLVDMDNDGDPDMLYGNLYNKFIVQMTNGRIVSGNKKNNIDTIVSVDSAIVGDGHKINMNIFPAAYYADGTGDNVPDIITAPFIDIGDTGAIADHKTYLYRNTGQAQGNHFEFVTDNFLQGTMLDYGEHAAPVFVDYNHDSLMDLVIATRANADKGYLAVPSFNHPTTYNPDAYEHLELYKNIGTRNKAVYQKVDDDFGSLKKYRLTFTAPSFADLDGDGRPDMFVGTASGKVMYFRNMADSGNTVKMKLISDSLPNVQTSGHSSPCLAHISNDSLFDLVMGSDTGTYSYYKNTGTRKSPQFKLVTRSFGNINLNYHYWWPSNWDASGNVTDSTYYSVYVRTSPAIADMDHNGKPDLISGSFDGSGEIYIYFNITDNLNGRFNRTDSVFYNNLKHSGEQKNLGIYPMPAAADLDNDGYPELLVGNYSGGIQYFGSKIVKLTKLHNSAIQPQPVFSTLFSLYPNPAKDYVVLQYYNALPPADAEVYITDMMGKTISASRFLMGSGSGKQQISTSGYAPGIYVVSIGTPDRYYPGGKLIITR